MFTVLKVLVYQWKAIPQRGSLAAEHIPRLGRNIPGRRIEASVPLVGVPQRCQASYYISSLKDSTIATGREGLRSKVKIQQQEAHIRILKVKPAYVIQPVRNSQNTRELKQDLLGAYLCRLLPLASPETGCRGPQCHVDSQSLILSGEDLQVSQFCLSLSHVTVARYLYISSIVQIPRHRQISER